MVFRIMDEYPEFVVIAKERGNKLWGMFLVKASDEDEAISACDDEIPEDEGIKLQAIEIDEKWDYLIPARIL